MKPVVTATCLLALGLSEGVAHAQPAGQSCAGVPTHAALRAALAAAQAQANGGLGLSHVGQRRRSRRPGVRGVVHREPTAATSGRAAA